MDEEKESKPTSRLIKPKSLVYNVIKALLKGRGATVKEIINYVDKECNLNDSQLRSVRVSLKDGLKRGLLRVEDGKYNINPYYNKNIGTNLASSSRNPEITTIKRPPCNRKRSRRRSRSRSSKCSAIRHCIENCICGDSRKKRRGRSRRKRRGRSRRGSRRCRSRRSKRRRSRKSRRKGRSRRRSRRSRHRSRRSRRRSRRSRRRSRRSYRRSRRRVKGRSRRRGRKSGGCGCKRKRPRRCIIT